jgi:hypothetical protein
MPTNNGLPLTVLPPLRHPQLIGEALGHRPVAGVVPVGSSQVAAGL